MHVPLPLHSATPAATISRGEGRLAHDSCTGHVNALGDGVGVADAVMEGVKLAVMEPVGVMEADGNTLGVMVGVLVPDAEN
jgi:hypothetical protein